MKQIGFVENVVAILRGAQYKLTSWRQRGRSLREMSLINYKDTVRSLIATERSEIFYRTKQLALNL